MNWLYFIVMFYIVVSALRGYHRGFFRVFYSAASLLVTIILVAFLVPLISDLLQQTPIDETMERSCEKFIRGQTERSLENNGTLPESLIMLENILPKELKGMLEYGNNSSVETVLESQGIYGKMAEAAADIGVNLISFFIASLINAFILIFIRKKLDFIFKLPGINLLNMIMGFFAGIVKAFIVIWLVFLVIKMTAVLPVSAALIELIEKEAVLKNLYDQNRLVDLLKYISI